MNCTHHINYGFKHCLQRAKLKGNRQKNSTVDVRLQCSVWCWCWCWLNTTTKTKNYECIVNCLPFMCGHLVSVLFSSSFFFFHVHHIETGFHMPIAEHLVCTLVLYTFAYRFHLTVDFYLTYALRCLFTWTRTCVCRCCCCCCYWYVKNVDLARIKLLFVYISVNYQSVKLIRRREEKRHNEPLMALSPHWLRKKNQNQMHSVELWRVSADARACALTHASTHPFISNAINKTDLTLCVSDTFTHWCACPSLFFCVCVCVWNSFDKNHFSFAIIGWKRERKNVE